MPRFAEKFPQFPVTGDLDAMLADSSVGAMMLLTTPDSHLDLVRRCAKAGKHILMEKPLEISSDRAVELVRTCRDAGVKLGICLQHRFRPAAEKLRAVLASGRLGEIVGASVYVHIWRPQGYYDEPGRGREGTRRWRRAVDPGNPPDRPVRQPGRAAPRK